MINFIKIFSKYIFKRVPIIIMINISMEINWPLIILQYKIRNKSVVSN